MTSVRSARGFTILELLISMGIMVGITGAIFSLVNPAKGTYRTQPEVSDMQQRLRVVSTLMSNDLMLAGAGAPVDSALRGSLIDFFAPVQPYRTGRTSSDPGAGVFFRENAITVMYVPANAPQTSLRALSAAGADDLLVNNQPGCSGANKLCSFQINGRAVVFDDLGVYDPFTITGLLTTSANARVQHTRDKPLTKDYAVGSQITALVQSSYYLNTVTNALMYYDGSDRDEAIASDVVDLKFRYFGENRAPILVRPLSDTKGPWTSYGPKPPPLGAGSTGWPAGESCTFVVDGVGQHTPRLATLGGGAHGLSELTQAMLTDGPWCPWAGAPNRYDADMLRVRKIEVRFRVQVGSASLRGPVGDLFKKGGSAPGGRGLVPDQEIRFEVSPRNFNFGR